MSVFGIAIRLSFLLSIGIANYVAYFVKNNKTDWSLAESYRENGITKRRYLMAVGKDWLEYMKDDKIATPVLALALEHQTARVASDATLVANFTEGWFQKF